MEKPNPNPSKDSTTKSPPSSPPSPFDHDDDVPATPTNPITTEGNSEGKKRDEGRETILKTPVQVLEELSGGDGDEVGSGGVDGGPIGGPVGGPIGGSVAVAVGGSMVVVEGSTTGGGSEGQVLKKRKNTQLKNPPSGIPTCPICKKEFATWKAAFGHMRKHPERNYRGFFKPPVFGASATADQPPEGDGGDNNSKGSEEMNWERGVVASLVRGLVFDLNQQWEGAGSSSGATEPESAPAPAPESSTAAHEDQDPEKMDVDQEGKKLLGFDLNEFPSDDDDEE